MTRFVPLLGDAEPAMNGASAQPTAVHRLHARKDMPAYVFYGLIALALLLATTTAVLAVLLCTRDAAPTPALVVAPRSDAVHAQPPPPPTNPTDLPNTLLPLYPTTYPSSSLVGQVKPWNLLHHLSGLYSLAMENGGNRVISGPGFNASVEYILRVLRQQTNLVNIERTYFTLATAITVTSSYFGASIEGVKGNVNYTYNVDWRVPINSRSGSGATTSVILVYGGCAQSDYDDAAGPNPPRPFYLIVRQNASCADANKIGFAQYAGASGLIIQGLTNTLPTATRAPWVTTITVVYMANNTAQAMVDAIKFGGQAAVTINLAYVSTQNDVVISNVCADTPYGDPTSVVLVGGHSDGVARGPGTNDDGSGSISTLVLALAMSKLMSNASINYRPVNMVKFCWFGAEESGLLGSAEVVRDGLARDRDPGARQGSRARDWAIMLDLDMLGSMNYQNWVYDANQYIPATTPSRAWQGSRILSNLFFEFFDANRLPRDSDRFDGRSDYGPFLVAGIPAGGVDAGADKVKNETTRLRYQAITGWGGVANAQNDQCYHQACDTIANIHWGVYTNMTQSSAYVTEVLAMKKGLRDYLGNPLTDEPVQGPLDHLHFDFRYGPLPKTEEELERDEQLGSWE